MFKNIKSIIGFANEITRLCQVCNISEEEYSFFLGERDLIFKINVHAKIHVKCGRNFDNTQLYLYLWTIRIYPCLEYDYLCKTPLEYKFFGMGFPLDDIIRIITRLSLKETDFYK